MPRIRTIKPEYWTDEKMAKLDPLTRLVFLGLISLADDAGRQVDSVKLIDGALFPATSDSCEKPLETLAQLGRIVRYTSSSGQSLIQIVGWDKHQKVEHPSRYVLPAPVESDFLQVTKPQRVKRGLVKVSREPHENGGKVSREPHESFTRVSGNPHAPILDPDHGPTTKDQGPSTTAAGAASTFNDFWSAYPKRSGGNPKGRALKAWTARLKEKTDPAEIIAGLGRYRSWVEASGKAGTEFVMQAATFLGPDRRWEEDWAVSENGGPADDDDGWIEDMKRQFV